jgi:hypothetical protein
MNVLPVAFDDWPRPQSDVQAASSTRNRELLLRKAGVERMSGICPPDRPPWP